ncbi:MAG: hypothetical protein PHY59_03360 [Methanobacterium sp.]|nr:hypothetical protein [Methanobacterium sp.]
MKNLLKGYTTKISATTSFQAFPDISGTRIVWTQIDDAGVFTLQYKNLATGFTSKLASSTNTPFVASIDGTRVVWMSIKYTEPFAFNIYFKDVATGKSSRIGTPNISITPIISGKKIVWSEIDSSNHSSLYIKDLATGVTKKLNL